MSTRENVKLLTGLTDKELDEVGGFIEDRENNYVHTYPIEVRNIRCYGGDNCVCNEVEDDR